MLYKPHKTAIMTDEEFALRIDQITQELAACRNSGYFDTFDGEKNYYEFFLCRDAKASVVILHGLSEFTAKYYEMAYYFLNVGYNVFLYDQRCHGFSTRLTEDVSVVHVGTFQDYVADLDTFIECTVLPAANLPLYIYSHSMGGAVATLYIADHPGKIQKAVLGAPMFAPITGVPQAFARCALFFKCLFTGRKSLFNPHKQFDPDRAKASSKDASRNRFMHNLNLRIHEPRYQSTPLTCGWVYNSLLVQPRLKKAARHIQTPMLLVCSGRDTMVKTDVQLQFAKMCPSCTLMLLENADHSVLTGTQENINAYLERVLEFLA